MENWLGYIAWQATEHNIPKYMYFATHIQLFKITSAYNQHGSILPERWSTCQIPVTTLKDQ